ncbi:sensor histidine kinase [Paenibacillus nanensis]|nr:sensor histidine kinase [Paenibacillus nanensis]
MNLPSRLIFIRLFIAAVVTGLLLAPQSSSAADSEGDADRITKWQMLWEQPGDERSIEQVEALGDESWLTVHAGRKYPNAPDGVTSAWLRIELPELPQMRSAIYMEKLLAKNIQVFVNHKLVYEHSRVYPYYLNQLIVPIESDEAGASVFLHIRSATERLGLQESIAIGEYQHLLKKFMNNGIFDVILGSSLILIGLFMSVSVVLFNRSLFPEWNSLSIIIISIGFMLIAYSPFLHSNYSQYGRIVYYSFDVASSVLLPSLFYFFEKVFGKGPRGLIRIFRILHTYLAFVFLGCMLCGIWLPKVYDIYLLFGTPLFALSFICSIVVLVIFLIQFCRQSNKDAIILTSGFSLFAFIGVGEMVWYFINSRNYQFFYWKVGVILFIISLIVILVRKVTENYRQMIKYSKQLEIFNNELQRSEKIEMISQLAASVAHEVRNPLQVTRGFLQLLGDRAAPDKNKTYMNLAISELDRASEIITDFLTFAKPGVDLTTYLNLSEEIHQIKAIVMPLISMQGGVLRVQVQEHIYIRGNSSKLKQALINMIKNSIEALGENGQISIRAERLDHSNKILICIEDNGEGIEPEDLKRLGEPYYSKKTKGTGLGLMVTYRIIEAMQGEITYESEKGRGTKAYISIPAAMESADAIS